MKAFLAILVLFSSGLAQPSSESLPSIAASSPDSPKISTPASLSNDPRIARVRKWAVALVPACPEDAAEASARDFLEDLAELSSPRQIEQLLSSVQPPAECESDLLRAMAARLSGSAFAQLRSEIARRRIRLIAGKAGLSLEAPQTAVAEPLERLRMLSEARYLALLEGRMNDGDLAFYLKRIGAQTTVRARAQAPGEASAKEIVAEFGRKNQNNTAFQKLQAYTIECRLTTATGRKQYLYLFKMRPEYFRLAVYDKDKLLLAQGGDGSRFWQQAPGGSKQRISPDRRDEFRQLSVFSDPLLEPNDYTITRLPDGAEAEVSFYRIRVESPGGSGYVARIDKKTSRLIGREESDGVLVRYSDFNEIGGLYFPFRQETVSGDGQKGLLEVLKVIPNPCLLKDFFQPPSESEEGFFEIERFLEQAGPRKMQ